MQGRQILRIPPEFLKGSTDSDLLQQNETISQESDVIGLV